MDVVDVFQSSEVRAKPYITHILNIERVCDRVGILNNGQIAEENINQLMKRYIQPV